MGVNEMEQLLPVGIAGAMRFFLYFFLPLLPFKRRRRLLEVGKTEHAIGTALFSFLS